EPGSQRAGQERTQGRKLGNDDSEGYGCREQGHRRKDDVYTPGEKGGSGGCDDSRHPGSTSRPHQEAAIPGMVDACDMKRCTFSSTMMSEGRSGLVRYSPSSSVMRLSAT